MRGTLTSDATRMLSFIEPHDGVFPCAVTMADGVRHERVHVLTEETYLSRSGGYPPEDLRGTVVLDAVQVVAIEESKHRLPNRFREQLLQAGEQGMGYFIFGIVYKRLFGIPFPTWSVHVTVQLSFVNYPLGRGGSDILRVIPAWRQSEVRRGGLKTRSEDMPIAVCLVDELW